MTGPRSSSQEQKPSRFLETSPNVHALPWAGDIRVNARQRFVEARTFGTDRAFLRRENDRPETVRRWQQEGHIKGESTLGKLFVRALVCRIALTAALLLLVPVPAAIGYEHRLNLPPYLKYKFGDDPSWAQPDMFDADWSTTALPNRHCRDVPPGYQGSIWYRLHFILPRAQASYPLRLCIGEVVGRTELYLNGTRLDAPERLSDEKTEIDLPPDLLRPGEDNVLAAHVSGSEAAAGSIRGSITYEDYTESGFCIRPVVVIA